MGRRGGGRGTNVLLALLFITCILLYVRHHDYHYVVISQVLGILWRWWLWMSGKAGKLSVEYGGRRGREDT